ncbi:MAG: PAS domain S-box protein [Thermodesulfobacteriota bacterium]
MTKKPMHEESEKKLDRVETEIRKLSFPVEQSIDGIAISDLELKLTYVNDAFARMHGYSPEQMIGMNAVNLFGEGQADEHKVATNQIKTQGLWKGEIKHVRKGGTAFLTYMSVILLKDAAEKPIGILGVARDITKQKQAEDAMRVKDNAIASSINAISFFSIDGHITYANDSFVKMWGYDDEKEVLGKLNSELWITKDETQETLEALISKGSWIGELKGKRKDGLLFDVLLSASLVRDKVGKAIYLMGSFLDISEKKRAEQILRQREADLQLKTNELEFKTKSLEEMNTALKVLLRRREEDRTEIEEKILVNVKELVAPFLEKLKSTKLHPRQLAYINILELNLKDIISPFSRKLSSTYLSLTPTEIQIANLVKQGRTAKEIAELLNVSPGTIETHRKNIRVKLGIKNKKANLRSYLLSLS